ncbi:hypothetical protein D9615_002563 [Tricholomella constricta]|uniref:Alpha/beta hydrolase fold-3 domain-containing protein n=1 Tax=Tricholomella constricta TaxID=117010 RepID=A0A8H5HMJ9_9AGAR|nr:hypothetical protein D9615_002563 [Tricholomella constricta]
MRSDSQTLLFWRICPLLVLVVFVTARLRTVFFGPRNAVQCDNDQHRPPSHQQVRDEQVYPTFHIINVHGGGWTLGNIASETSFVTNMGVRAKSVVVSVDYRLAPENPYPAAIDDAIDTLQWFVRSGAQELGINTDRIAVGGSSSGGNLTAILALKAPLNSSSSSSPSPTTPSPSSTPPFLPPGPQTPTPPSSPPRAWPGSGPTTSRAPRTSTTGPPRPSSRRARSWPPPRAPGSASASATGFCGEVVTYAASLRKAGVQAETRVYKGAPHPLCLTPLFPYTIYIQYMIYEI